MDLVRYIRDIPDFPKPGILFKDITPLLASPEAFQAAIQAFLDHHKGKTIDALAAAEARGFLFAAPPALAMKKPLVPLRKPGKLPYRTHSHQYDLEYGQAEPDPRGQVGIESAQHRRQNGRPSGTGGDWFAAHWNFTRGSTTL